MTTMDLIKSCRPNVYAIGHISGLRFTSHVLQAGDEKGGILAGLYALRQEGVICTRDGSKIVVFYLDNLKAEQDADQIERILQARGLTLSSVSEGAIGDESEAASLDEAYATDLLMDAIDAAVGVKLAEDPAIKRLAPRAWLYSDGEDDYNSTLIRLRFHYTPESMLYAATTFENINTLAPDVSFGSQVVLCPVGLVAEALAPDSSGIIADATWKRQVLQWLEWNCVSTDESAAWTGVKLRSGERISWPSQLVLAREAVRTSSDVDKAWKRWFSSAEEIGGFLSPLTFAEDWYNRAGDREEKAQKATENGEDNGPAIAVPDTVHSLATSPPFIQRVADQQAAMNGIYPTPPDGPIPASQLQMQPEGPMQIDTGPSDPDMTLTMADQTPNEQNADTFGEGSTFPQAATDLFGEDMGAIDFAGDIGDADFSFFDEPDEALPDVAVDVEMDDAAATDEDQPAFDEEVKHLPAAEERREKSPLDPAKIEDAETRAELTMPKDAEREGIMLPPPVPRGSPEKPLSPFGIKERLLPPPIPASAVQSHTSNGPRLQTRRSSNFEPVVFRNDFNLSSYTPSAGYFFTPSRSVPRPSYDISLPPKRKKSRVEGSDQTATQSSIDDSESEEDSYDSESSSSDDDMPPKLPWDNKKRKRASAQEHSPIKTSHRSAESTDGDSGSMSPAQIWNMLEGFHSPAEDLACAHLLHGAGPLGELSALTELLDLSKMDIIYVAQIIGEQSMSAMPTISKEFETAGAYRNDDTLTALDHVQRALDTVFFDRMIAQQVKDVGTLALVKEPPSRSIPAPGQPRPGQPRPHPRTDSTSIGPDLFVVPPPYVKLKRGADSYELLPPALDFWETLSLGPSNGPKDVRAYCVFPWSEELHRLVDGFLSDVSTAYESCKLGSHVHVRNIDESQSWDDYEDGFAPVELGGDPSLEHVQRAYKSACIQLGTFLANVGHEESSRTFVVYMINPFENAQAAQYLCTCFWLLCKAYRDNAPKNSKKTPRSDVVLQLIPISMVASEDLPVICSSKQLATLAREVYDRCPPAQDAISENAPALRCLTAPAMELSNPPPKRIGFQLAADPPNDLMHEGSALHLSYAVSADGFWLAAVWTDMTGRYQRTQLFCLRGRSVAEAIEEAWERTKDILLSREVFWRVFILINFELNSPIIAAWRKVAEKPRKQSFSVTLLMAYADPFLRLLGPSTTAEDGAPTTTAGVLTPAATPGGTVLIVSPEAGQTTAPPTPAPSDTVAAMAENDPEAHLVDLEDETWGMLFSESFAQRDDMHNQALACGAIYKSGKTGGDNGLRPSSCYLPSLDVRLLWTIQVRPNGNVDEGHVKQAEMTLREVLKMYRNLNALTRAKQLVSSTENSGIDMTAWPVHLVAAHKAAQAVDGFLK